MRLIKLFGCLALITGLAACNNNDTPSDMERGNGEFDRKNMLTNVGQNVILPNYRDFAQDAKALQEATQTFRKQPSEGNLTELRSAFKTAYHSWQYVTPYNFGPAQQMALRDNMNTFPTDPSGIEERIQNGNRSWGPYDNDTKGFPALDYFLFQEAQAGSVVDDFQQGKNNKRSQYLQALVDDIVTQSERVLQRWEPSGGNYLRTFSNATANDKGSSMAQLVNQLNFDFEIIKDEKIGIPAGKKSMGEAFPEKVEGYYGSLSLSLAKANLDAIEDLFLGRYEGTDGLGLDDHLDALDAERNGNDLSSVITDQFQVIRQKLKAIPQPLPDQIRSKNPKVDETFRSIKRQVVFIKTEMPSALGVRITYQDNDGD